MGASSTDYPPETGAMEQKARDHGGTTRRRILQMLNEQDYIGHLRKELGLSWQTVHEHVTEMQDDGLIEFTGIGGNERRYYRSTELGRRVLDSLGGSLDG